MMDHGLPQNNKNNESASCDEFLMTEEAIYELHRIAQRYMGKENPGHTLQATALVNEAYLSIYSADIKMVDKLHFFALAANHMRRILVDHARKKSAQKRQGNEFAIGANDELIIDASSITSLVLLDEVLTQFSALDERAAKMYEMRIFAGLSNTDLSKIFKVSVATIEREIKLAKAWINLQYENK